MIIWVKSTWRLVTNTITGRRTSTERPVAAWIAMRKGVTGKEFALTSWKTEFAEFRRARTTWSLCKRRTTEAVRQAAKFGRIDDSRAERSSWRLLNLETIAGTLSWSKILKPEDLWWNKYFLEPTRKPIATYTDNSVEFGMNLWSSPRKY